MTIAVDVDGVLRDFAGQVTKVYKKFRPDHEVKEITEWELDGFFPIGKNIYDFIYQDHPWEIFTRAPVYEGAELFTKALHDRGITVVIATSQRKGQERYTLEWLDTNEIYYDSILFSKDKNLARCDILIDDYIENLINFDGFKICFDRPWNKKYVGYKISNYSENINNIIKIGKTL